MSNADYISVSPVPKESKKPRNPTSQYAVKGVSRLKTKVYSVEQDKDDFWVMFHELDGNCVHTSVKIERFDTEQAAEKSAWILTEELHKKEESDAHKTDDESSS